MHWWVAERWEVSPMLLVSWIFWVVTSIVLHELSHGFTAMRLGDDTPYHTGHITLNPLVHMGHTALIMFALFGFTWGAMPISPGRLRGRYAEAMVAAAGPLCNLGQFVLIMIVNIAWDRFGRTLVEPHIFQNVHTFLWTGSMINLMGFCFNLIPVPPLDGSRILGDIFPRFSDLWRTEHGMVIGMIAFGLLFMAGGGIIWGFVMHTTQDVLETGVGIVGGHTPRPF